VTERSGAAFRAAAGADYDRETLEQFREQFTADYELFVGDAKAAGHDVSAIEAAWASVKSVPDIIRVAEAIEQFAHALPVEPAPRRRPWWKFWA
jgi:hypothetical protein